MGFLVKAMRRRNDVSGDVCMCMCICAEKLQLWHAKEKASVCDCKPLCNHRLLEALFCYYHNKQKVIVKVKKKTRVVVLSYFTAVVLKWHHYVLQLVSAFLFLAVAFHVKKSTKIGCRRSGHGNTFDALLLFECKVTALLLSLPLFIFFSVHYRHRNCSCGFGFRASRFRAQNLLPYVPV